MKTLLFCLFILTTTQYYLSQEKNKNMKTFDIEKFNKNKDIGGDYIFKTSDYMKIRQFETFDSFVEEVQCLDAYIYTYNEYYKNGIIKTTLSFFYNDFILGIKKEYDKEGRLVKETDLDAPYYYSWEDVKKYIAQHGVAENKIKEKAVRISRWHVKEITRWELEFHGTYQEAKGHLVITLDGKTGEELEVKLLTGKGVGKNGGTVAVYDTLYTKP